MGNLIDLHSKEVTLLILMTVILLTLIVIVPQLLRAHLRKIDMQHIEHMKSLELGQRVPTIDERARLAGRLALLVPMVVMISAGTVTGCLAIYNSEQIFPVSLATWVVAGVVSLAAITGGVALVTRLAHLDDDMFEEEDEFSENPYQR
ncbi:MAG: hypothetical protein WCL32_17135 [Planctomycetota bacterium]